MSQFKITFGKHLKMLRKERKLTQERLAELVNLNPRQISKIETGDHFPSSTTIELICIKLDVSPRILFNFDFCEQEFALASGSDEYFPFTQKYSANIKGNLIHISEFKSKKPTEVEAIIPTFQDADEQMLNLAFETKKEIVVEYIKYGKLFKIVKYLPNKTFELLPIPHQIAIEDLLKNIQQKLENENYFKFLDIATKALDDSSELDKLETIIMGMKISNSK